jgi:hypothetical protein
VTGVQTCALPIYRVVLPDGWLKDPYDCAGISEDAELDTSGG